jgi:Tfp pilus assembly protein FimT
LPANIFNKTRAFSLIEFTILLLIIGILSTVAFVEFNQSTAMIKLTAATFKLRGDILYAQNLAVTQQINYGIVFTPSTTYSIYRQTTSNIITDPLSGNLFTVNFGAGINFKEYAGVTFSSPSFGNRLEFDRDGIPYSDGGVTPLSSNGAITLSNGMTSAVVTITKNTGKVN